MAIPQLIEQTGRVLAGRYRLVAPIGTGVSAAVYLADDTVLRRRVAIKLLHTALAGDQAFLRRFQSEAHTAAGLSHPNIMRVLDWGDDSGGPFLVLEYLGGGSLRSLLDHYRTISLSQAVQLGIQTARALDYAHRRGLVHRDIKPANLLFDEEGRLAIADFGLARALAEAALTEPGGSVLGTARYASPEQVRGQMLDGGADVYSLSLVLIEAITGSVPFAADTTLATLMARLDKRIDIPEHFGELASVLHDATDPNPVSRISAADLARALEGIARELPEPERLKLPGALVVDVNRPMSGVDSTMMPGVGESVRVTDGDLVNGAESGAKESVSVAAKPLPLRVRAANTFLHRKPTSVIDGRKSRRRRFPAIPWKRIAATMSIALLISALTVGGVFVYFNTGRSVTVPSLVNLNVDAARYAASEADLKVIVSTEFHETVETGVAFEQTPNAGDKAHVREPVRLVVSKGPAPRDVPGIVGKSRQEAKDALGAAGFVVDDADVRGEFREDDPKGRVLSQDPSGGKHDKGTHIKLVVSDGPKPRLVPSVANMSEEEAVAALKAQQLVARITQGYSETVPAGKVSGSTPGAGASVARDSTVNVIISRGPELVTVPDVTGMSSAAATERLAAVGLKVTAVYGPPEGATVFSTTPSAGTKVKKGTEVSVYKR